MLNHSVFNRLSYNVKPLIFLSVRFISKSSSVSPQSFAATYLIQKLGFSPESAMAAAAANRYLRFKTPENADSILEFFKKRGFSKTQIAKIIKSKPRLANDLRSALSKYVTQKDCFLLADICSKFWKNTYKNMDCLISLIRYIGWIVSSRGSSVVYKNAIYTTVQKYMKQEPVNVWIYDKKNKKRRQVTLRVSTDQNDKRKSEISNSNVESNFLPKLNFFQSKGVSSPEFVKILFSNPTIFDASSLEKKIIPCFNQLSNLLQYDCNAVKAIKRYPLLISSKLDVCMLPNIIILRENGVPEGNIISMFINQPGSFVANSDRFKEIVKEVKEMRFDPLLF